LLPNPDAGNREHSNRDRYCHLRAMGQRRRRVANTRWRPPLCLVVDWVAAAILVVLIAAGVDFHH
jgi:hypothetical protein